MAVPQGLLAGSWGGSLAQRRSASLVAILSTETQRHEPQGRPKPRRSLQLVQGSLSARRVERQSPLLASLHRISTGVLAGLGLTVVGLSGLALHWQNVFAANYAQLQASRNLEQKLQESAALLEQHHLAAVRRPGQLVPTSSEQLIHIQRPAAAPATALSLLTRLPQQRIPAGY
jgi:hypothetical protein